MCIFVCMKTSLLIILLVSFFTFFSEHTYARKLKVDPVVEQTFLEISHLIFSRYSEAIEILDSLEEGFLEDDYQVYSAYVDYTYAFIAYRKGKYEKSMSMAESALEQFMYESKDEWSAKCLLLLGHSADITRLFPEAILMYEQAIDFSTSERTLGSAYLGIARNKRRIGQDWQVLLGKGVQKYVDSGFRDFDLHARLIPYWFNPDSSDIVDVMPYIAEAYEKSGSFSRQADAYKCLAVYYQRARDYKTSLDYIDFAISCLGKDVLPSKVMLSSVYHLRGEVLFLMGRKEESHIALKKAIQLNIEAHCRGNNYQIYKYMYLIAKRNEDYQLSSEYAEEMLLGYRVQMKSKMLRISHLFRIFRKVELIQEEVLKLKRQANNRIYISTFLLFVIFGTIIFYLRSKNVHIKRVNAVMESRNNKLMEETGDLLEKVSQGHHKTEIINTQKDMESKVDRIISKEEGLSSELKDKYAETLLTFDVNLQVLTSTERRYAVMIALGVPYKSIANLLSVQPGTVAQYRNRIRKKLDISNTDIDLEEHLKTFL